MKGMKADGIAVALQHGAFEIVIEQDTRTSVPGREAPRPERNRHDQELGLVRKP
jgi:hypothetical protein